MPTAARVVAALCLGLIAFFVAGQVIAQLPDHMNPGKLRPLSVVVGLLCGWFILGSRADGGVMTIPNAIGVGISAMVAMVFWVLFLVSGNEALRLSLARRFDGPVEAVLAMFPIAAEYGQFLLNQESLAWLIGGGIIAGVLANLTGKVWR